MGKEHFKTSDGFVDIFSIVNISTSRSLTLADLHVYLPKLNKELITFALQLKILKSATTFIFYIHLIEKCVQM